MALFQTVLEIKNFLGAIQKNLEMTSILSFVEEAEIIFIEPILGEILLSDLKDKYKNNSFTNPKETLLLEKVQRPLAHLTFYQYKNLGNVFVSDIGFQQTNTENTTPAPKWALDEIAEYTQRTADSLLNNLVAFLEKNKADFPLWEQSEFFHQNKELLINSTVELQKRIYIENSRIFFYKLRPSIRLAEHKYIANTISETFLSDLKSKYQNDTLNDEEKKAIELAKDALAHFAFSESLPGLSLFISPNGVRATMFQTQKQTKNQDIQIFEMFKKPHLENGQIYLTELKKYLDQNPDLFPLYRDSGKYNAPPSAKSYDQFKNEEDSTIFYIK